MSVIRVFLTSIFAPLLLGRVSARPNDRFSYGDARLANTSDDPFYNAPPGFESTAPGTILRSRPVPKPIAVYKVLLPVDGAWQLLYRTQDSLGRPDATVVTVIKPKNAKPDHLFSQSYSTSAAWSECNPSKALQLGSREDNSFTEVQNLVVLTALTQGWYVCVSDDIGSQGAYSAGPQMGYATIDSIRAAMKSTEITGLSAKPVVTMNGYSGGALAVEWASELQPTYAPELKIAGASLGGLISNISHVIPVAAQYDSIMPQAIPSINGMANGYPNLTQWLHENLKESKAAKFWKGSKQCTLSNIIFYGDTLGSYFKRGIESYLHDPIPQSILSRAGQMGLTGTPKVPWYLYMSNNEFLTPISYIDNMYDKFCANGASIHYERNTAELNLVSGHLEEAFIGFSDSFRWLQDVHAGKGPAPGCKRKDVNIPSALWATLDVISWAPKDMFVELIVVLWQLLAPSF